MATWFHFSINIIFNLHCFILLSFWHPQFSHKINFISLHSSANDKLCLIIWTRWILFADWKAQNTELVNNPTSSIHTAQPECWEKKNPNMPNNKIIKKLNEINKKKYFFVWRVQEQRRREKRYIHKQKSLIFLSSIIILDTRMSLYIYTLF